MFLRSKTPAQPPAENPLIAVVRPFDHRTRQALYAATNNGLLRRRTWNGCALNRAANEFGQVVTSQAAAADLFHLPRHQVANFINVWDRMTGTNERCTALLRDAILAVGLFPGVEPGAEPVADPTEPLSPV